MNRSMKSEKPSRKSLNASTISSTTLVVGLNRLSRNLRKSFNDIYTITTNKLNETRITRANPTEDDLKENHRNGSMANHLSSSSSLPQPIDGQNQKDKQHDKESKYSLKLKKFKNRILQTTNTLFNRKKKNTPPTNPKITALSRRKSISSPHILNNTTRSVIDRRRHNNPTSLQRKFDLDDVDLDDEDDAANGNEYERTYNQIDFDNQYNGQAECDEIENDQEDNYLRTDALSIGAPSSNRLNETNQSFVNSVKNYLKRNRSQKIIDSNNELKHQHQQQQQQHHMQQQIQQQQEHESNMKRFNQITNNLNKRPKFY